jgi:hypothetical protein
MEKPQSVDCQMGSITLDAATNREQVLRQMLLKRMDTSELRQVIAEKDAEQAQVAAFAEQEVNKSSNPFLQQEQQIANR